jgi:hypothetical protein
VITPSLLADGLVLLHLAFVGFVVFGGLLVAWRIRLAWLHLPAAAWGLWITLSHGICPLTPLENHYRALAGEASYSEGFIAHYILPMLYPPGLTATHQRWLGAALVIGNLLLYGWAWWRWRNRRHARTPSP